VKYDCDDSDSPTVIRLPFDADDHRVITQLEILQLSILDRPVTISNGKLLPMSPTIFIDGGARPNPGPAAAAIVLRSLGDGGLLASKAHARYYPLATNNITEAIAMTAALRKAHRLLQNSTHQHINIVMDSELV
jgi:hypothetical protein